MKIIKRTFITGLFTLLPLVVTLYILYWMVSSLDSLLQEAITALLGIYIPGLGFVSIIAVIFLTGLFASNILGKWFIKRGESIINRLPLVKTIYSSLSDIQKTFTNNPTKRFSQVALIDFPVKGTRSMGFIASEDVSIQGTHKVSVFVPTAPNPTNGFLLFLDEADVEVIDIPVDTAIKMIISMGSYQPEVLTQPQPISAGRKS